LVECKFDEIYDNCSTVIGEKVPTDYKVLSNAYEKMVDAIRLPGVGGIEGGRRAGIWGERKRGFLKVS